ncbi:hypothetical protein CI784_03905 [Arthrobacter agilis]|nr:hypothetical protein B8W74_02875 [Arthrobacter agilis]PPB47163.1 hypothetical protein CI784_03905 [Arthrobacter agilis]
MASGADPDEDASDMRGKEAAVTEPALPYLRSLVLVSLILSVSSASHVLAAGHLPAPGVILLLGVLLLLPLLLLARRTVSFSRALVAMGAGQALLHTVFSLTAVPAVCQSSSAMPGHHAAFELACSPVTQDSMAGSTGGLLMLLLHAVATIVLAAALARSDQALTLLRAWLRPLLDLPGVIPLPATPHRSTVLAVPTPVTPSSVHAAVPTLRGPPSPVTTTA